MDTTKEYIEMCRKAEEIQTEWEPNIGDYYIWNDAVSIIGHSNFEAYTHVEARDKKIWGDGDYNRFIVGEYKDWVLMHFDINEVPTLKKNISKSIEYFKDTYRDYIHCFWLPHQDQLQDMIGTYQIAYSLMYHYKKEPLYFIGAKPYYPFNVISSAEMLWLCFVMHEKYGKRWDGTDWVVE